MLDALSLRELPVIAAAAQKRGITPARIDARASQVPTETEAFAAALGLAGRSKLANNKAPGSFIFAGPDTHTDVLDLPFEDCVGSIPASPRLFLWHTWLDEKLIHLYKDDPKGHGIVAAETKTQLSSDGFWKLADRMRRGRRLVITSDHGYAVSQFFSSEVEDEAVVKLLRQHFHGGRCAARGSGRPLAPVPPAAVGVQPRRVAGGHGAA